MKKWVGAAVAVAVLAGAGWYFGSPSWTLYQMKSAAEARDAAELTSYIDFPTLRETTKEQLRAGMAAKMAQEETNGFAALGGMLAMSMVDSMIDGILTPSSIRMMFAETSDATEPQDGPGLRTDNMQIERDGFSQFRLVDPADKTGGQFVFRREGLSWKLSEIQFPKEVWE